MCNISTKYKNNPNAKVHSNIYLWYSTVPFEIVFEIVCLPYTHTIHTQRHHIRCEFINKICKLFRRPGVPIHWNFYVVCYGVSYIFLIWKCIKMVAYSLQLNIFKYLNLYFVRTYDSFLCPNATRRIRVELWRIVE